MAISLGVSTLNMDAESARLQQYQAGFKVTKGFG